MSDTITLPTDLAEKVRAHVESGAAADAVALVRAGLEAFEAAEAAKFAALRAKIAAALDDPRPSIPADDVYAEVERLIDAIEER